MTLDLDKHDEEYKQFKMKQQTNNKWRNAFIATLIIVIIIVGGFLIINQWGKQYYNGIQYGVNQTIQVFYSQLRYVAFNCKEIIVQSEDGNYTAHLIAEECLQEVKQ
jgi:hypothetical protein